MNWDVFASVCSGLGALATTVACCIALYQTRLSFRKKMKVVVDLRYVGREGDDGYVHTVDDKTYLYVMATNICEKNIIITGFGFRKRFDKGACFINPVICSDGNITPFSNHVVEPQNNIWFCCDWNELKLDPNYKRFSKYGYFFVSDSTNRVYKTRITKDFKVL